MIDKLDNMVARDTTKGFITGTNSNWWKQQVQADKKYYDFCFPL